MAALLQILAALVWSHGAAVGRQARAIAVYGALLGLLALVTVIYLVILVTHLLAMLIGTAGALAIMTALAGLGCLLMLSRLRAQKRRLLAVHREHLEQERLALRAAGVEAVAAGKLGGSIAAVSASLAAVIVLILRRLGTGEESTGEESGGPEA